MIEEDRGPTVTRSRATKVAAGAALMLLFAGSAAYACTQRVGTMTVCRPPSSTYIANRCGKVTSVTQTGNPTVYSKGSAISVQAKNFYAKRYAVTFRLPGSTASCHAPGPSTIQLPDSATTFLGPTFTANVTTPAVSQTGQAKVCTQDVPDIITGQIINLTVI